MNSKDRSYVAGKSIAAVMETFGWIIVSLGLLVLIAAFGYDGFSSLPSREFGGGMAPIFLRLIAALPGMVMIGSGLLFILQCQIAKATIDTAETTREILAMNRGDTASQNVLSGTVPSTVAGAAERSLELKGRGGRKFLASQKSDGTVVLQTVAGPRSFNSVEEAAAFID